MPSNGGNLVNERPQGVNTLNVRVFIEWKDERSTLAGESGGFCLQFSKEHDFRVTNNQNTIQG